MVGLHSGNPVPDFSLLKKSKNKLSWNEMKNHYNVLELEKNCTAKEIKDSYIKLSKKYHPDKNKSKEAEKKILEINEAYSILKNAATRNRYDERLRVDDLHQQMQQNIRQNTGPYYHNRFHSYDDYVNYYKKVNSQGYAEPPGRKFTVVLCCCLLMVFGAGLRIMYACSDSYRRKKYSEMLAQQLEKKPDKVNPQVEQMKHFFEKKSMREQAMKEKKAEP